MVREQVAVLSPASLMVQGLVVTAPLGDVVRT